MNTQKILKKLLSRAEQIDNVVEKIGISEENLTEASLDDVYDADGKIYLYNGILYRQIRKDSEEWLFFKVSNQPEETENDFFEAPKIETNQKESRLENIESRLKDLEKWAKEFREYIIAKFQTIEQSQEETLREIKEYIDNKLEEGGAK